MNLSDEVVPLPEQVEPHYSTVNAARMSFAPPCDQFAEIWHGRKTGRPIECGQNMRSADVCHPFLGLGLGCGSRLCWKLEHCCFLTSKQVSQKHDLPVGKFQRIMMS